MVGQMFRSCVDCRTLWAGVHVPIVNPVTAVTAGTRRWINVGSKLQGTEGTMFNRKAQECVQIFEVTLAVGTFLALAAMIPA